MHRNILEDPNLKIEINDAKEFFRNSATYLYYNTDSRFDSEYDFINEELVKCRTTN